MTRQADITDSPLITICVTSYNHEPYIRTCIDSLLGQTYPHIEVRVIDDCSSDATVNILRSYGDRIHLVTRDKNLGIAAHGETINEVIRTASGEFFYRIDSDDFIEPHYLQRLMTEVARDPSLDWICGGLNVVDAAGKILDSWTYQDWPVDPDSALARGWRTCSVVMPHNGLFSTRFLRDNDLYFRHFDYGWGEDVLFTIRGMLCRPKVKLIHEPGFNWRTHGANHSCDVENRIKLILAVKEYYLENIPEALFLKHSALESLSPDTAEYRAARDFLVAVDLLAAKQNFSVPAMFQGTTTQESIERHLGLFDDVIRRYARRSLAESSRHQSEIDELYHRLDGQAGLVEGRRSLRLRDFRLASRQFGQALDADPASVAALDGLCEAHFELGEMDLARNYSRQALRLSPSDNSVLNNAGVLAHSTGEFRQSEEAFCRSLELSPRSPETHSNLLNLYATMSQREPLTFDRTARLLSSVRSVLDMAPAVEENSLLALNRSLRQELIRTHTNAYQSADTRILLHQPDNGALKYLMASWAEILTMMGVPAQLLPWAADMRSRFESFKPTAFITVSDPSYLSHLDTTFLASYRSSHAMKVGLITTLEHAFEPVDFFITFHLNPERHDGLSSLDRPLLSLPFGFHPLKNYMRAGSPVWDYFFVGSNSHRKKTRTELYLDPIVDQYSGILAGTGWKTGIGELTVAQAAPMYNLANIYPNYHLQEQVDNFNEVNERTHIIAASGAFQIVDNPSAMRELYSSTEMVVAESPSQFMELFEYYLANPDERLPYVENGMRRAWREYSLATVLSRLADFLGTRRNQPGEKTRTNQTSRTALTSAITR